MKKRSRAHEAGSIEAGSSISKSIFLLIVLMGQSLTPNGAFWDAQECTEQPNRASQASTAARSSQSTPRRDSQALQGAQLTVPLPANAKLNSWLSNFVMDFPAKLLQSAVNCEICIVASGTYGYWSVAIPGKKNPALG